MSTVPLDTLGLLERRLARIEFHLGGQHHGGADERSNESLQPPDTVYTRLAHLETRLRELCTRYPQAAELTQLYNHNAELTSLINQDSTVSNGHMKAEQTTTVLGAASLYPQAASDLGALQRQQIPDNKSLANLVALGPRIEKAMKIQDIQSMQECELRDKSAELLSRWYQGSVLQSGEQWAKWEDRMSKTELRVRREEHSRRRDAMGL